MIYKRKKLEEIEQLALLPTGSKVQTAEGVSIPKQNPLPAQRLSETATGSSTPPPSAAWSTKRRCLFITKGIITAPA